MTRARRLRRATVEGRVFTVRSLKKIIILEKLFTIILLLAVCFGFGYMCITQLDRDVTMMLIMIPVTLHLIFSKTFRIPVLKIFYETIDAIKNQEVWNDRYDDYDRYYDYEDHCEDDDDDLY